MKWLLIIILLFCGCHAKRPQQSYANNQAIRMAMLKAMTNPTWGLSEIKKEIKYQLYLQEQNGR